MQRVEVEQRSQLGHDAATNDVSAGALPRGWLAARRKAHSRVAAQDSREGVQIGIGSLLVDSVVVDWAGGRLLIGGLVERLVAAGVGVSRGMLRVVKVLEKKIVRVIVEIK